MNVPVTGFQDRILMNVYNASGATLAKGTIVAITGAVQVIDSANPSKVTIMPSVVDAETGAGQAAEAVCGVVVANIADGTQMDDGTTPYTYMHDGIGQVCIAGKCEVEAGGTIVAGEAIYLDMASLVVNVDGVIGAASTPATGDYGVGVALEAAADNDVFWCIWRPPVYAVLS